MTLVVFPTAWVDFLPDTLVSPDVAVKRAEEDIEDPDEEKKEEQKDEESCLMFEMKRKSLSWALLKHEMVAEMTERNIVCESFGPKTVRSVRKTFKVLR